MSKKILINITNGFSLRFICHTDILSELIKNKFKVYLLSTDIRSLKKNIKKDDNIFFEQLDSSELNKYKFESKFYNFLELLRGLSHGGKYKTPKVILNFKYKNSKKYFIYLFIYKFFNNFFIARKILYFFQSFYCPHQILNLINEIKPDMILTTSLGVFSFDEYVLRASKKLNIKSICAMLSWDNSTTRGYPAAYANYIFTWTDIMKKELIYFSDCKKENIFVTGIPHFDHYYNDEKNKIDLKMTKKYQINSYKKNILFITKGPSTFQFNPNIIEIICSEIKNGNLPNCHLYVRVHPLYFKINQLGKIEFQDGINIMKKQQSKFVDEMTLVFPEMSSLDYNFDIKIEDKYLLKELIINSDVIINIFSTVNIEGSILNKPLININYDNFKPMYKWNKKHERQSLKIDRELDHNTRIIESNCAKMVNNNKELIMSVKEYLNDSSLDQIYRKKIYNSEAGPNKGLSGKKVVEKIINLL